MLKAYAMPWWNYNRRVSSYAEGQHVRFLADVNSLSRSLYAVACLSVVCRL